MIKEAKSLVSQFNKQGFISPISIFTDEEINSFQKSFIEFEAHVNPIREDYENLHFHAKWTKNLATHPNLLDLVEAIIGPEILIYETLILSKIPSKKSNLSWHQDQYFLKHKNRTPYWTAWVALTSSTIENGCMKIIRGSHLNGIHTPFTNDETNLITKGEQIELPDSHESCYNNLLNPGQLSLHDGAVIDASSPNLSDKKRVGFIVRYVTP